MTDQERVLRDFLTLTWWVDVPGACILLKDKRRSGTEVRELVNLREAAARALSAPPPSATAAPGDVRCHKCGLRGRDHDMLGGHAFDPAAPAEEEKCPGCGGRGRITRSETWEERCPACGGSGLAEEEKCPECYGSGRVPGEWSPSQDPCESCSGTGRAPSRGEVGT